MAEYRFPVEGTVEIEIVTRNQKGEPVVTGTARAVLPARR